MESFSYSRPLVLTYSFGSLNFDTANVINYLQPPPNAGAARVVDIHVRATVTFAGATNTPQVEIGTAASVKKYAFVDFGALAAGSSANLTSLGGTPYNEASVIFSDINLARDGITDVRLEAIAPTGTNHAGTGYLDVSLAWF